MVLDPLQVLGALPEVCECTETLSTGSPGEAEFPEHGCVLDGHEGAPTCAITEPGFEESCSPEGNSGSRSPT